MKIPDQVIEEIRNRADIVDIVGRYTHLVKKGGRHWACCPFHTEKTPSFTVTQGKNIYYCFGCHKGGDVFNFVMEIEKLNFVEAIKVIGKIVGVPVNFDVDDKRASQRQAYFELHNRLAKSLHYLLYNNPKARQSLEYLSRRAFSREILEKFQVGYIPGTRNWLFQFLRQKNYSSEFLAGSGLFSTKYSDMFPYFFDRIMFPIFNLHGDVIAFGGRTLSDKGPKYLNSPETEMFKKNSNLYGIHLAKEAIRKSGCFYLVEGYLDVIAMHQGGFENTVAPLGTALTENQVILLKRYAEKGILLFDADEAGMKATVKGIELLEGAGLESEVVELPEKSDPADILEKDGISRLNKLLKCSINSFEYLVKKAMSKFDEKTPSGKEKILSFIHPYLDKIDSRVKRDGYFNLLSEYLEVGVDSVRSDFSKNQGAALSPGFRRERIVREESSPIIQREPDRPIVMTDELFLMLAVTVNQQFFSELRNFISLDIIEDDFAKELYIALEEAFREDKTSLEALLEKVENKALKNLIIQKDMEGEFAVNQKQVIYDGIYGLKKKNLSKRREQISNLLRKYEKTEPWKMKDLLIEKMVLDREFEELRVLKDVRTRE